MKQDFEYKIPYWDVMLKQNTDSAKFINAIRWHFVKEANPKIVLDYGSGVGWFRTFAPKGVEVDTYDIANWPQTGIKHEEYDLITFWDVLEHIPDLEVIRNFLDKTKHVATSLPILPEGKDFETWKHNKPGEHVNIFTKKSLSEFFETMGFKLVNSGYPECCMREDIYSALFKRI